MIDWMHCGTRERMSQWRKHLQKITHLAVARKQKVHSVNQAWDKLGIVHPQMHRSGNHSLQPCALHRAYVTSGLGPLIKSDSSGFSHLLKALTLNTGGQAFKIRTSEGITHAVVTDCSFCLSASLRPSLKACPTFSWMNPPPYFLHLLLVGLMHTF